MTAPGSSPRPTTTPGGELQGSIFGMLTPALRRWKMVLGLPAAVGLIAAAITLVLPPTYTATTTFIPAVGANAPAVPGGLASLATQFGFSIGGASPFSPHFFSHAVGGRARLRGARLSQFD